MPEQTPPALIHAGRRGGKLARLIAVETARGGELEIDAERDMWRERAERGQLHRDQLVDQLNAARARVAELEAQQQPRVIETPEDAAALADALRAAVDSWPNRAWLVLPGPTDIGSELAGHLTKELAGWRPPARVIADPEELSALPAGALVHDGTAVFDHLGAGWWVTTGSADPIHSEAILEAEPDGTCGCTVIVLRTPEQEDRR